MMNFTKKTTFSTIAMIILVNYSFANHVNKPFCFGNELFVETVENYNYPFIAETMKVYWEPYNKDMCYETGHDYYIDYCDVCIDFITNIEEMIKIEEIQQIIKILCNDLPAPSNKVCLMIVSKIIDELENTEPKKICEMIKMC